MKKSTKLSAFTLIELLIVIAIIGILAGLMSGAIANVMSGANATKIGNNGRNIINALMQTNQDREAAALGNIWPKKESTKYSDANTYFGWLMEKQYLSGISLPDFAGAGINAANDVEALKTKQRNVWCVLGGCGSTDSYTPVFWTKNLNLGESDTTEFEGADASDKELWSGKLVQGTKPFDADLVVVIRKGGAMQVIKSKQLYDYTFFGGSTNDTSSLKILTAIGYGETGKDMADDEEDED